VESIIIFTIAKGGVNKIIDMGGHTGKESAIIIEQNLAVHWVHKLAFQILDQADGTCGKEDKGTG